LAIDDSTGFRSVLVSATVEICEDIVTELPHFRTIRVEHGIAVLDDEHLRALTEEGRVPLAINARWAAFDVERVGAGLATVASWGSALLARVYRLGYPRREHWQPVPVPYRRYPRRR
jgi:hypothetical protein